MQLEPTSNRQDETRMLNTKFVEQKKAHTNS